jgi:uncharacterized coiled-coil DUF342 family protein
MVKAPATQIACRPGLSPRRRRSTKAVLDMAGVGILHAREMDPSEHQRLVERIWLLEQLRAEAKERARRATSEARQARQSAADAGEQAAELHDRVGDLGEQLADLHDQLGESDRADEERAEARAEHREAADERGRLGD